MIDARQLEVKDALQSFLRAFENCDLPAMDRLFAPDCVSFDQVVASSAGQVVSDFTSYRRCAGMPPAMRRIALELPTKNPGATLSFARASGLTDSDAGRRRGGYFSH